jgi:hypothetical protein
VEDHFPSVIPLRYARIFPTSTVSPAMILRQCRSLPGLLFKRHKHIPCISMQNGGYSVSHSQLQSAGVPWDRDGKFPTCWSRPENANMVGWGQIFCPWISSRQCSVSTEGEPRSKLWDKLSQIMRRCARNKPSSIRELTRRGESSTYPEMSEVLAWILDSAFYWPRVC